MFIIVFIFWIVSLPKWISETQQFDSKLQITGCNVLLLKSGFAISSDGHGCDLQNSNYFGVLVLVISGSKTQAKYMFSTKVLGGSICPGPELAETCWNWKQMYKLFSGTFRASIIPAVVPLGRKQTLVYWCCCMQHSNLQPTTQEKDLQISIACLGWGIVTTYLRLQRCHLGRSSHSKDPCTSVHS